MEKWEAEEAKRREENNIRHKELLAMTWEEACEAGGVVWYDWSRAHRYEESQAMLAKIRREYRPEPEEGPRRGGKKLYSKEIKSWGKD
jgi:hypothetical protein